jgi:putative FmdB family regulatory protein
MPFYEYQCKNCGHELEAMQKVSDAPLRKCPQCGKAQLQRLISAPVFRLKGGGWYETDFKDDKEKKRNLAERPEAEPTKDDSKASNPKKEAPSSDSTAAPKETTANKAAEKPIQSSTKSPKRRVAAARKRVVTKSTRKRR